MAAPEGTAMELDDCAFPLLAGLDIHDDPKEAFDGATSRCSSAPGPRTKGMERADLLEANGAIFTALRARRSTSGAADDVKVLVVGNPANTNCLIAMNNAPDVPRERFTAMMRLDHNRAVAQLANKLGAPVGDVTEDGRVGQPLAHDVPRTSSTPRSKGEQAAVGAVDDQAWIEDEFIPTVGKRGAAIIEARGASSAASAANAAIDHVHDWVLGTGRRLGLDGRPLRRLLRRPEGLICGFPCTCSGGEWSIVQGLEIDDFSRERRSTPPSPSWPRRARHAGKLPGAYLDCGERSTMLNENGRVATRPRPSQARAYPEASFNEQRLVAIASPAAPDW